MEIISSGLLVILIIVGSFGAVGTTSQIESKIDCGCNTINEVNENSNNNYFFGELISGNPLPPGKTFTGMTPTSLDWRNKDGADWTTPIKDQDNCGSCYAFGSLAAMESCINIEAGNPNLDMDLSEQFMVSCGKEWYPGRMKGCDGAYPEETFDFLDQYGAIDETCFPYTSGVSGTVPSCSNKCDDWQDNIISVEDTGTVSSSLDSIRNALNQRGPLSASFDVFEDFMNYSGGIYEHQSGGYLGVHRIAIVGYDDDPGYWICKNSWGPGWGENGWFRIAYGECGIEAKVYYVDPNPSGLVETHCFGKNYIEGESSGDIKFWGSNGVQLSEGSGYAIAVYHFNIVGDNVKEVGINYIEQGSAGNGPAVYIYNINSGDYECLKTNMGGTGSNLEWKWVSTNSGNYISSSGLVKVKLFAEEDEGWPVPWRGDDVLLEIVGIRYTEKPKKSDLDCEGSLSFGNRKSGTTVTGTFTVKNIGDPESKLNWKVDDYPKNWGSWTFIPGSGLGLTPENGKVTVTVKVVVPTEFGDYSGTIKIINKDNSNDYETISVSLTSPKSRSTLNPMFPHLLETFPLLQKLLQL